MDTESNDERLRELLGVDPATLSPEELDEKVMAFAIKEIAEIRREMNTTTKDPS